MCSHADSHRFALLLRAASDWLGARPPSAVALSDGFKCSRCEYQDVCDQRVVKYQRVGRKPAAEATDAATSAAAVMADAASAAALAAADIEDAASVLSPPGGRASKKAKQEA